MASARRRALVTAVYLMYYGVIFAELRFRTGWGLIVVVALHIALGAAVLAANISDWRSFIHERYIGCNPVQVSAWAADGLLLAALLTASVYVDSGSANAFDAAWVLSLLGNTACVSGFVATYTAEEQRRRRGAMYADLL